jgi:hypothetical protein
VEASKKTTRQTIRIQDSGRTPHGMKIDAHNIHWTLFPFRRYRGATNYEWRIRACDPWAGTEPHRNSTALAKAFAEAT